MSVWQEHEVQDRVLAILGDVPIDNHHFRRPYTTAYQLAIEVQRQHPDISEALGVPLGGAGVGERTSLAQYLAGELSKRIRAQRDFPVEGAFLSGKDEVEIRYRGPDGGDVVSSLTGSGWALSMYRLR